ncbi:MAG: AI-2E family transporter [Aestuariivirga sp.]|nr:AI-2E family transporter [Aestuariivirga sp.]
MRPLPAKVFRESILPTPGSQDLANGLVIFLAVCAILYFGQSILIPIVLAILLSLLLAPCVKLLQKLRIPKSAAIISVVCIAFAILFAMTAVLATSLTRLAGDLPQYESNLREKARSLKFATSGGGTIEKAANVLKDLQVELQQPQQSLTTSNSNKPIPVEIRETNFGPLDPVITAVAILIHPMTQFGIVLLMVVLILFNREDLRNRLIRLAGTGDIHRTTTALDDAGQRLSQLFTTQLLINGLTGAFIGVALAFIGIPGAILWGVLTAVMRFVPYVGTLLSAVFPVIIAAAIGEGWTLAFITIAIIFSVEIIVGQVLEPLFFGKMTGISTFAIVASVAFWAALWGPIGLILATPLTIGLLVIGRNIESLKFFDVLLGSEPVLTPEHAFYQRLLASDPLEAAEQADAYLKEERLDSFINEVAVPGLMLANHDHLRGVLSIERQTVVAHSFSEMLDEIWPDDSSEKTAVPVLLVSAHGPLNFAATLALSALLKTKNIPHEMLPEATIAPGKFPEIDMANVGFVCLCYLTAPSEAKHNYVLRRLTPLVKQARVLSVTWAGSGEHAQLLSPANAASLLPAISVKLEESSEALDPALALAIPA